MSDVAALFVDPRGPYPRLLGADLCWDEARDARLYPGALPVVAHPPCQLWGAFAAVNFKRWGGEHNRPGNDGGCFRAALDAVNTWGGVLEHPKASRAWARHGLARPTACGWSRSGVGWVCEVWQSAYGHRAAKATWLYCVVPEPPDLDWRRPKGTHQIGFHDQRGPAANLPTLGKRESSATPPRFAELLIGIARMGRPS
ncbi:MAG TPA: hypothetical protein VFZ21_30875 [Gemmatimonadaceae bacterium]|nr:hypothetical protein [Gemmatimonadaceae bacterium]